MAYWGQDPVWQSLSGPQRAAAMALLEAETGPNGININDAHNALGAIINRSEKENQPLEQHISRSIYQPIIEDSQRQRLNQVLSSPEFNMLSQIATERSAGRIPDWVGGADHYLAPPSTMLALEAKEPNKYRSWRDWTGFDPNTGQYKNVVLSDNSHQFLNLYGDKGNKGTSASPNPQTPKQDNSAVFPFLAQLLGLGGEATAASAPAMAAGSDMLNAPLTAGSETATNLASAGSAPSLAPLGGPGAPSNPILSNLLRQFSGGQNPQGADTGLALAQNAQKTATGGIGPFQPLQRRPIDLSQLQALMQNRPMLGYGFGARA